MMSQVNPSVHGNSFRNSRKVLITSHGDGFLEVFAEPRVDVHIERVPVSNTKVGAITAEKILEHRLPVRFRALYWPGKAFKTGHTRPLTADTLQHSLFITDFVGAIDSLSAGESEVAI